MSEPPILEVSPVSNRFAKFAAVFSILAPLIAIFSFAFLFEYLKSHGHTTLAAISVLVLFAFLLIISALVFGIVALAMTRHQERKGIFGKALIGICLNGLLLASLIACPFLLTRMAGHKSPTTPQGRLDEAISKLKIASTDENRFYALNAAAKESFKIGKIEDADNYARELLKFAPNFQGDWNYGNAIPDGNLVLGRIAVRDGRIEESKHYLLEAGKSPGSPQMNSFGPNMSLANDLLQKGERDTVLQYFELCGKFWIFEDFHG